MEKVHESSILDNVATTRYQHIEKTMDEWTPVSRYAPEFTDKDLDMPAHNIDQQYFQLFTSQNKLELQMEDVMLAHKVIKSGVPNRWGCRIPVRSGWHVNAMEELLVGYQDWEITEWLRYGFPVSYDDEAGNPTPADTNHLGATLFPDHIDSYFEREIRLGATIGPFAIPPFLDRIGVSPLSSRPKKDSESRCIILDLSYPFGESVNDSINKEFYCGEKVALTYPTVDTLAKRIIDLKPNKVLLYKRDLARYFRQVPICPSDYSLIGMRWRGHLYFDKMMPMGLRSAAYVCQRLTNAITYMHRQNQHWVINYLDNFGSAETEQEAWKSYNDLAQLFKTVGVAEAEEKAVPPTTKMEFLGTWVDSENLTLEITKERRQDIFNELQTWGCKQSATKKQVQSLIGKLNFVTNCVRGSRIFMSRLIQALQGFPEKGKACIPVEMLKDVEWWIKFMPQYNGMSMLWLYDNLTPNSYIATDTCMIGGGGHCGKEYFHFKFSEEVLHQVDHILQLELLTVVVAIKLWVKQLRGKIVRLYSDNEASVFAVNKGKTCDQFMLKCLREIAWVTSTNDVWLKLTHCPGYSNEIPDLLSRWYSGQGAHSKFKRITDCSWKCRSVSKEMIMFVSPW